jgi:Zn-finger nucleic acid-binding protein
MTSCTKCGAPRAYDRERMVFACGHCGTDEPVPVALHAFELGQPDGSACPLCKAQLHRARVEGWPVRVCIECFGVLADMSTFESVAEAIRFAEGTTMRLLPPRRQQPGDRYIDCPLCQRHMFSHHYAGPGNVVIDTCERCLVNWLDVSEIRRIALSPRAATRPEVSR